MKAYWRIFILLMFIGTEALVLTNTGKAEHLDTPTTSTETPLAPDADEPEGLEGVPLDSGGNTPKTFDAFSNPAPGNGEPLEEFISLRRQGELFYMEFRNAEIKDVLRALSQENNLNIIIGENVEGSVTLSFKAVTFDDAFKAILRINNLNATREGNIVRVIKSPLFAEEAGLVTKMIEIDFAIAEEVQATVKGILSKNGVVMADARTNTLVIRDLPSNMEKIAKVVKRLDRKTPQVMIEARIVEVNTNFSRELGVQWGGQLSTRSGNTTTSLHGGGFKDRSDDLFSQPLSGGVGVSGGPFAVNLPVDIGRGRGGAFGLSIGNVANTRLLDIQLSALEDSGNGRILSNPVIMTLNNKEARISSGTEILIPTTSIVTTSISSSAAASGGTANTGVTTINAKLELKVTPHVTSDDQILIHVQVDKKDADFSREVQGIPPLTTRTAETYLLVKDQETIVIGGIFTHSESDSEAGVPWLSKIPVIGWLFKKETKLDTQNELMIFITPTIHRDGKGMDKGLFEWSKNKK